MTQAFRTTSGGRIDRKKAINFTFNGQSYIGYEGDTLASALLANGVHLLGRSFKYHRPRGIVAAGAEEPNSMVQLGEGATTEPNIRATQISLYEGLKASSVNVWPNLELDISAINGLFAKIMTAGFYNKTFMWPRSMWMKLYEPVIRRAAGWGKAPAMGDPDIYDHMHLHVEVMVVGGGPAGLMAAMAAGRAGARVLLVDEQNEFGGSLLSRKRQIGGKDETAWIADMVAELEAMPDVTLLRRSTAFGYYDHNYLCVLEQKTDHLPAAERKGKVRQRVWHIRAGQVVLATGAHERPLVFADNDSPGIMLAGSVQTYVNRYGVLPGKKMVLFTNNDTAYEAAIDLQAAGGDVVAIIDCRTEPTGELVDAARALDIEILAGHAITGTSGGKRVSSVEVRKIQKGAKVYTTIERNIDCDLVAMSGGWSPVVHLFSQSQGQLEYDEEKVCFLPGKSRQAQQVAGALAGQFSVKECLAGGYKAGADAARATGFTPKRKPAAPEIDEPAVGSVEPYWIVPSSRPVGEGMAKHFVDLQNDTTAADIELAVREGFESVEHIKRYTLTGFGTDQGKTSNINALAILSGILDKPIPKVGTTTFRPPYTPVSYGALAGRNLGDWSDPVRVTSIHDWHVKNGALFENVGQWKRPWYFPKQGETMQEALNRECLAVRNSVGVLDASTLGKIDIRGPDAAEFLNRIYTNAWAKLGIGRVRYGLMCHEDGMVFDDGTTARLAEDRFLMTTTTGGAAGVLDWLEEYLQTEWPELKVYCTSVTEQWATVSITGPKAGAVLEKLAPEMDLSHENFPFLSFKEGEVAGINARIFRISFTGELTYEINVPWTCGLALWKAVMAAGAEFDITPYGTESMHILRAEKGFIIVGQETDGTTTPQDLGMDWIVSKKKPDFIGKRSFTRSDTARPDRKQLVGLLTETPDDVLPEGSQLVFDPNVPKPIPMAGHVTSSYYSAALGRSIALALVKGGHGRKGQKIFAPLDKRTVTAEIVDPVFYDKEGDRLNG
ncbi:sarcosine oxidase subunit alpha [Sneathiella litorea]|uniref:Sarcosine oxidase subunit alpha family protein n=1 Tax=Sneathiella litorea TaxID=2606216 RepID=A0A6L8WBP6_9PROT|nr:sarcosine oxidase subunit alpha [Sneathiella litorea]MZR31853.1 sarcosine oxidase subunit alpha family protein [Sneathiella litorea]